MPTVHADDKVFQFPLTGMVVGSSKQLAVVGDEQTNIFVRTTNDDTLIHGTLNQTGRHTETDTQRRMYDS